MDNGQKPRWRIRLEKELAYRNEFLSLSRQEWLSLLSTRRVTSDNHDTELALDWPHYCKHATEACGGAQGWCYTFQGHQASAGHNRHAAMVDALSRYDPDLVADKVATEVNRAVKQGWMQYPNLRYSGSGEASLAHLPAMIAVMGRGIRLWGFTRDIELGQALHRAGASVIYSSDRTTEPKKLLAARKAGLALAYTAERADEAIPDGTVVTFPVHRVGRVKEVPDTRSLCPKVLHDFFEEARPRGVCQTTCRRCHEFTADLGT